MAVIFGVLVGGSEVRVGWIVTVGGTFVIVGRGVCVAGNGVLVGRVVAVGGINVLVGRDVGVGTIGVTVGTGVLKIRGVAVGMINVLVGVGDRVGVRVGIDANAVKVANADDCNADNVGVILTLGVFVLINSNGCNADSVGVVLELGVSVLMTVCAVASMLMGDWVGLMGDSTILTVVGTVVSGVGEDVESAITPTIANIIPPSTKIAVINSLRRLRVMSIYLYHQWIMNWD